MDRYARQLVLSEVGVRGQERLDAASVAIVGVGGLGSPVAMYLAAAGVGRLSLFDDDVVDLGNLHRQVLYLESDVGRRKVDAAADALRARNGAIRIDRHPIRVDGTNARSLVDHDVVIDCSDTLETRSVVNDACIAHGVPCIHASIYRFEGIVTLFGAGGPCFRCLYPDLPEGVSTCTDAGVLGVVPGWVGMIQASEALKWLLGIEPSLAGRVLVLDMLAMQIRTVRLRRAPDCPVCAGAGSLSGRVPAVTSAPAVVGPPAAVEPPALIEPEELAARLGSALPPLVVDVRTRSETAAAPFPQARGIPLADLAARLHDLPRTRQVALVCATQARSTVAFRMLREAGFDDVRVLRGGVRAWRERAEVGRDGLDPAPGGATVSTARPRQRRQRPR